MSAEKRPRIVGFGECLIDFIPVDYTEQNYPVYECCPGGSVANLCVAVARQGAQAAYIGKVGGDGFGTLLYEALQGYGVDTQGMQRQGETFLAFVYPKVGGGREYIFCNQPNAQTDIQAKDVDLALLSGADIVQTASVMLSNSTSAKTTLHVLDEAVKRGIPVSYDINWRASQHQDEQSAYKALRLPIGRASVVKGTVEEIEFITDLPERQGAEWLLAHGAQLVLVTRGAAGSSCYHGGSRYDMAALNIKLVDETGCGDCYLGSFLLRLLARETPAAATAAGIQDAMRYASAAAGLAAGRRGAMAGMPKMEEIEAAMRSL